MHSKKDETGSERPEHRAPKQSRSRVIQTCLPCHRSKRKCNRGKPCSQCLRRQITGSCVYEAVAAEDLQALDAGDANTARENEILRSRVADLEAVVAELRGQHRDAGNEQSRKKQRSNSEIHPADKDGVYYGRSYYLGAPAAPKVLERMMSLVPNEQSDLLFAFSGGMDGPQASQSNGFLFPTLFPATYGVKEMMTILQDLGREQADAMLDSFFDVVDPIYHYVATPWLMQRYEKCWDLQDPPMPPEAALIFAVLALGDLVSSKTTSWPLIAGAFQLLRISNFLTSPSMDTLHTFCFSAVYLMHDGKLNEYWPMLGMVIRLAQSMGLHRDPKLLKLPTEEGDIRRRLFYTIAAQETDLSVMFGRPNGIGFSDCKLPNDVSDAELFGEETEASNSTYPHEISYNRLTWQLMEITQDMIEDSYDQNPLRNLPRQKAIETRIRKWYDSVPVQFKFDSYAELTEESTCPGDRNRKVQSLIIHITVNHNILVLYRRCLLSGAPPEAAATCFEAAIAVAESWKALQDNWPKLANICWMHWFRAFHAALICVVAVRASNTRPDIRSRALECWNSCLLVFSRLQSQNESILCCWRALSRLDIVVKEELNVHRPAAQTNLSKNLIDPSYQLRMPSAGGKEQPFKASTSPNGTNTIQNVTQFPEEHRIGDIPHPTSNPQSLEYSFPGQGADQPFSDYPTYGQAFNTFLTTPQTSSSITDPPWMPQMNIFDMDVSNWPLWLTQDESPMVAG